MPPTQRFIPTLQQVQTASRELPLPDLWPEEQYVVAVQGRRKIHEMNFRKIAFLNKSKEKVYRWVYEGKVFVGESKGGDS